MGAGLGCLGRVSGCFAGCLGRVSGSFVGSLGRVSGSLGLGVWVGYLLCFVRSLGRMSGCLAGCLGRVSGCFVWCLGRKPWCFFGSLGRMSGCSLVCNYCNNYHPSRLETTVCACVALPFCGAQPTVGIAPDHSDRVVASKMSKRDPTDRTSYHVDHRLNPNIERNCV